MVPSDKELILLAQKGNHMAFEQLIYRYDKQVLSIAATYTNNQEDAKDIYQEVFIRVYRSLSRFQFRSEFFTWLYRIAVNTCLSYRARGSKYPHISLDADPDGTGEESSPVYEALRDEASTDQKVLDSEISRHIDDAMKRLSPQQKMVFTLRHYHGYKLKEIASIMKCAEGTIKKYLFEATERLRDQLKNVYS